MTKLNKTSILFALAEGIFGVLLLCNPYAFTTMIIRFFGILFLIIGTIYMISYFSKSNPYSSVTPIAATLLLIFGLLFTFGTNFIFGLFSFVAMLYGAVMFVYGIFKIQYYFQCKKVHASISALALITAIVSVVVGIIVVFNPFTTNMTVLKFIGISLIVEAVVDIVDLFVSV